MAYRKLVLAAASAALVVAPVTAQASQPQRASAPASKTSKLAHDKSLLLVIGTIAVTAAAIVLATSNNLQPASP